MKRLIVNADDFGLTEKVNQAIIQGHLEGIITSASLLATGAAFESAVTLARQHPKLGVGVHLNLTEGMPVSEPASIPSLVTEKGLFLSGSLSLARKVVAAEVTRRKLGREPAGPKKIRAWLPRLLRLFRRACLMIGFMPSRKTRGATFGSARRPASSAWPENTASKASVARLSVPLSCFD